MGSTGSGYRPMEAQWQEVNNYIFSTVNANTARISLKIYVGVKHL